MNSYLYSCFCQSITNYKLRITAHRSVLTIFLSLFTFHLSLLSQPAWSRGEQLLSISFETAMQRAETALRAEGYVNIYTQANIKAGYKGSNTAVFMCNEAPGGRQWINIVVSSITNDAGVPGYERERLQAQMNNAGS